MHSGRIVFAQLLDFLPRHEFNKCVLRHRGNRRVRRFSCFDQFLAMAFAQLTGRESLRDIETCLRAMRPKLYHAGFRGLVSRSTLADANENRDACIYADFAQVLIRTARRLYANESFGVELDHAAYVLDSTLVHLCLSLFPWARYRKRTGAIKLHTLMDLRGSIPCVIRITHGLASDVSALDTLVVEPGAFYIMDRGYIDFGRLHRLTEGGGFFVVRAKSNFKYARRSYRCVDKSTGLRSDQTVVLKDPITAPRYADALRRVAYFDAEMGRRFVFLTNHFTLPAHTVAELYRCRWQIEVFFRWIKQNLRIKSFFGTSLNAVTTQVWIAISAYMLVAIVKKELQIDRKLGEILQILSITLFEKVDMYQVLAATPLQNENTRCCNQLGLFDF